METKLKVPNLTFDCPTMDQVNKAKELINKYEIAFKEQTLNTLLVCCSCNHEQPIKESTFIVKLYYKEHDDVDDFGSEYHWSNTRLSSCNKCSNLNELPKQFHNELLFKDFKYLKDGKLCDDNKSY